MYSLEEYDIEGYFDVSLCASCFSYSALALQGFTLFSPGSCFSSARLAGFWRALDWPLVPCDDRCYKFLG